MKVGYIRSSSQKEILAFQCLTGTERVFCDLDPSCDIEFNEMLESLNSEEDTIIIKDISNACLTIDDLFKIVNKHSIDKVNIISLNNDLDIFLTEEGYSSLAKTTDFANQVSSNSNKKKLGRKMIAWPTNFRRVADDYISGAIKISEALNALGIKKCTFYSMLKLYKH